jgi:trimeric autotransporter adhesin
LTGRSDFFQTRHRQTDLNQAEDFPRWVLRLFGTRNQQKQFSGEKERTMNPLIRLKTTTSVSLVAFGLACFGLLPDAQAVSPAPDGGYPGGNTAEGQDALLSLTTGGFNTAVGFLSLKSDTTNSFNTAIGAGALLANTADKNTATGAGALLSNTTGLFNTANGAFALLINTTGNANAANGKGALLNNTTGSSNTAIGVSALNDNTTGNNNTALGVNAGSNATTGFGNVYVGASMSGVAGESNSTYIRNVNTTTVSGGGSDTVTVDLTTGLLGHLSSSLRYKEDIKPMNSASEALYRLKPVTYHYKKEIDRTQSPAFGLIAEEVAQVNPDLVAHNSKCQPESVHYEMVNAMLLNEFLKEHRKVEQLTKDFESKLAEQQKQIEALTAGLQKVSAQLEVSKPAPQTVLNNH